MGIDLHEGGASFMKNISMARHMVVGILMMMTMTTIVVYAIDTNNVFDPCSDAKIQKSDGFTFGLAFSAKDSFFFDHTQLSPCDSRLSLSSKGAQLAIFRPKVDEMTLLRIDSNFNPAKTGGYMVAFAGRQYAARSDPTFVADSTQTVSNFTLVMEFQAGTLQNLYWKKAGCGSCKGEASSCVDNQDCATPTSKCKSHGGPIDCTLNIQLSFSGTDKNLEVLNSWYEVERLQNSVLSSLFPDVPVAVGGQPN